MKDLIGIVGSIIGGFIAFYKLILPYIKKRKMLKRETRKTLEALVLAIPKIDKIYSEVTPNGGGSIKDVIGAMQQKLDTNEQISRLALNEQDVSYYQCDNKGNITIVSSALCRILGRREDEIIGNNWMSILHPDDRESVIEDWENSSVFRRNFEHRCRMLNGDGNVYCEVMIRKTPIITGKNKDISGYIGTMKPE